jgi:threonine/homoserine/homoserine lactone efflux protein
MRAIDEFTIAKAGGAGFALSALNPKNMLLTVAAAAEIAEVGLSAGRQVALLLGFVLAASAGVLTPLAAGSSQSLDGPSQRGDHGPALPTHRCEADR